jgi:hypothetical protein
MKGDRCLIIFFAHLFTFYSFSTLCALVCVCKLHDETGQWINIQFFRDVPLCCVHSAELHTHPTTQRHTPDELQLLGHAERTPNLAQATKTIPTHKLLVFMATRWRLWTSSCSFSVTKFTLGWPSWEHRWVNGERGFLKVVVTKGILCSNTLRRVIRKEPGNHKLNYKEQAFLSFKSREITQMMCQNQAKHCCGYIQTLYLIAVVTYRHCI